MNIIDLAYCVFYRYDEKHDIGFPLVGAPIAMAVFILFYIISISILLWDFKVIPHPPHPEFWQVLVALALIGLAVALRFWTKETREKRFRQYEDYKTAHPKLYLWRFWIFVSLPIVMTVTSILIANAN